LGTLRTFHAELIYFGGVEVASPCFDGVKTNSLGHHVVTALATHVKGSLIAHFAATDSLAFDDDEGLLFWEVTFPQYDFVGIVVFGSVEVISSCCG